MMGIIDIVFLCVAVFLFVDGVVNLIKFWRIKMKDTDPQAKWFYAACVLIGAIGWLLMMGAVR